VFLQYPTVADTADPNRVVPSIGPAAALVAALKSDQSLSLTGKLGRAAVADPTAATTGTPAPAPAPTASGSTAPSTAATPAPTSIALPSAITGQSADQNTCTSNK